jgi:hypothetical protein
LTSNNNININSVSNGSVLNSTSSSNHLFDKRIDQNKQIINAALPFHFSEFRLISIVKDISLENYFKSDEIDSPENVKVSFSGNFNLLVFLL